MSSNTEIANLAISHLGIDSDIANLDTENSEEARACRRFFDLAVNTLQRKFPYPFTLKQVTLGLVTEDPNDEWKYEYQYPADCQFGGRIISGLRNDNRQSRAPYIIARGASGKVIWTDCVDAKFEYHFIETDEGRYDCDFILAISYKLAELVAPRLTAGDPFGLGPKAAENFRQAISVAEANALNEEQPEEDPHSEFIRAREGIENYDNNYDWVAYPINYRVS